MERSSERVPTRVLGWCLMPNHFHLVLWPREDGELAKWMQWLMTSHVRRHHRRYHSTGHVWQGRFKSFPIQRRAPSAHESAQGELEEVNPLWTVLRYVERSPLRADLVAHPEDWPWSSYRWWRHPAERPAWVNAGWLRRPAGWEELIRRPQTDEELSALRRSVKRGRPFGRELWTKRVAAKLGLESTLRPRGRPRKKGPA